MLGHLCSMSPRFFHVTCDPIFLLPLNSCPPGCVSSFVSAISSWVVSPCGISTIASFFRVGRVCVCVCVCVWCEADFAEGLEPRNNDITFQHCRQVKVDFPVLKNISPIPVSWKGVLFSVVSAPHYIAVLFLSHLLILPPELIHPSSQHSHSYIMKSGVALLVKYTKKKVHEDVVWNKGNSHTKSSYFLFKKIKWNL